MKPKESGKRESYKKGFVSRKRSGCVCLILSNYFRFMRRNNINCNFNLLVAGIPSSKLVEAHGTFSTASCTKCGKKFDGEKIKVVGRIMLSKCVMHRKYYCLFCSIFNLYPSVARKRKLFGQIRTRLRVVFGLFSASSAIHLLLDRRSPAEIIFAYSNHVMIEYGNYQTFSFYNCLGDKTLARQ